MLQVRTYIDNRFANDNYRLLCGSNEFADTRAYLIDLKQDSPVSLNSEYGMLQMSAAEIQNNPIIGLTHLHIVGCTDTASIRLRA